MHKIFVYGTLRKGYGNHRLLEYGKANFLGDAVTRPNYTMLHLGGFPGVIAFGDTQIQGELYEVDDETLYRLDRLEGHPGFYERTPIKIERNGVEEDAEIYLLPTSWLSRSQSGIILSGDWKQR